MTGRQLGRRTRRSIAVRGILALAALGARALADTPPGVTIECSALDQEATAALEARALGVLLVSSVEGQLSLECEGGRAIAAFRADSGEVKTLGEPLAASTDHAQPPNPVLEQLVDLVARLMGGSRGPGASDPAAAAASGAASDRAEPPSEPEPSFVPAAPLPSPFEPIAERPRPSPPTLEGDPPSAGFPSLRLGTAAELWSGAMCCTAGFVMGAAVPIRPDLRLSTNGSFEMGVREVRDIAVRHARFGIDLELDAASWVAVSAGVYVSAVWLEAPSAIAPGTRMSVQPLLALQASALVPVGAHTLALGPVLRGYARERALQLDSDVVTRQPALTLGLAVELRIRL